MYVLSEDSLRQMIENVQNGIEDYVLLEIETGVSLANARILPILIGRDGKTFSEITGYGSPFNPATYPDMPHVKTNRKFRKTMNDLFLNQVIHTSSDPAKIHNFAYDIVDLIEPLAGASGTKFNSIIQPPVHFTGRETELDQIWRQLVDVGSSVIVGAGGIGKSSLAAEIATIKQRHYCVISWIPCNSIFSIVSWFLDFLVSNSIAVDANLDNKAIVEKGMQYLHSQGRRQLFVLDNVDNEAVLDVFTSKFSWCDVLITSRSSIVHLKLRRITTPKITSFNLEKWSTDQSKAFFAARLPNMIPSQQSDEFDAFQGILQFIDGFPLVAEQVAAFVETKSTSWTSFEQSLQDVLQQDPDPSFAPVGPLEHQETSLAAIMQLSFELIGTAATHLYSVVAYFKNDGIQRQLLEASCDSSLSADINATIQLLLQQSLLHTTDNVHYKTHSLQQLVSRNLCTDQIVLQCALDAVANCFPKQVNQSFDSKTKELGLKLAVHIEQLSALVLPANNVATNMYGLQQQILQQLVKCLDSDIDLYQEMKGLYAVSLGDLGLCFKSLGDFNKAESCMKQSIDLSVKVYGTCEHVSVAATLNNLEQLAQDQEKYDEAQKYYKESLDIKTKMFGTHEHVYVAATLNNLGLLAKAQRKYDEAQQYYKEDLEISVKMLGTCEHVDVATILLNLGALAVD
ncbi:hypothetical protein HK100_006618 [Physocladia obscura]|uniref:NB-ARC domain-containing protein n=1 Tax=Physocladia obscura TaxID=109957 RepID=A0AAD5SQE0_9FUNG|nr:hypothetical protein HK100_006618 [Physocladia obscura]